MRIGSFVRSLTFAVIALTFVVLNMPAVSSAQIGISITIGPPALPVYEQPPCPDEGFLWTPGYWAYADDYYWVPGTWVRPPQVGFLWTPGYWGWGGDRFAFHEGYWGPHVGFYGGINYGYGFFGVGFEGGRWDGDHFFYNRSVTNVNVTNIHNVYNKTVINNITVNRVSYNGGRGGITARASAEEEAVEHERHVPPVAAQEQHREAARNDPQQRASVNHGKPPVAATPRAGELRNREAVPAKEAGEPGRPAEDRGGKPDNEKAGGMENNVPRPPNAVHPNDLPAREHPASPNTGDPKLDQKYQKQQEKLGAQQDKQRQKLQQQQEQEHQKMAKQNADDARKQQVEQRHQQQTQQLQQKHQQQQQKLQEKQHQASPAHSPK